MYFENKAVVPMTRLLDKQATVRIICQHKGINIIEMESGAIRFIGQGVDLMAASWTDLNPADLNAPDMQISPKRHSRYGLTT